jgi:hypothetical protein
MTRRISRKASHRSRDAASGRGAQGRAPSTRRARKSEARANRRRVFAYIARTGFSLLIAVFLAIVIDGARLYFTAWGDSGQDAEVPSIGLVALDGTDLSDSFLVSKSPSLDLDPSLTSGSTLYGAFRINAITTPTGSYQQFGLVLPSSATAVPVGAGGETIISADGHNPYNGYGFSCETSRGKEQPTDVRDLPSGFPIVDAGGNSYKIDCLGDRMVVWTRLETGRTGKNAHLAIGEQALLSNSAAHVLFQIPNYSGIQRLDYYKWRIRVSIETGPLLTNAVAIGNGVNRNGSNDGVVTLGNSTEEFGNISPSNSTLEHRTYTVPILQHCQACDGDGEKLFDGGPAITWRGLFDGNVHELSANITDVTAENQYALVTTAALLLSGLLLPSPWGFLWIWKRTRRVVAIGRGPARRPRS